ncbi:MAG: 3'(2'),5'-bisphosphate nucleotidase CysQ, partial [Crocinitomicaceae bacterium]
MLKEEYFIALKASVKASEVIMDYYSQGFETEIKADGSPVTQADLASSEIIETFLSQTSFPITSEEMEKIPFEIRKEWTDSWCVDPLDGTKEFVKKNGEFAVNIAHIRNNEAVFGIIASPVKKEIIFGGKETGVFICSFDDLHDATSWIKIESTNKINSPLIVANSRSHNSGPVLNYVNQLKSTF